MFGEMWISAAGASNSRRRLRGRLATPRQTWRGHDSTNSPLEALPRLSSLGGHANSALLPTGHGHPLSLGLSFSTTPTPSSSIQHLTSPIRSCFRHLHVRPQGRPLDSGGQTASLSCPPEEDRTSSRSRRGTSPPQAKALGSTALAGHPGTRPFHGHRHCGCGGLGKNGSCMRPFAEQILAYRAEDLDRRIGGLVKE